MAASKDDVDRLFACFKCGASPPPAIKFTGHKQMSPIVFYGSPQGVPVKKPLSLLRLLREIRIDLKKQTDLIPRDVVWATFPRQEEAIRFSKAHMHTNVFSYQDHKTGTRRFLVSTYDEFWKRYNDMDPKIRHHYEVIQEFGETGYNYCVSLGTNCKFFSSPQVCSQIAAQRAANPNLDKLYITKESSSTGPVDQLFMDTAVYSRNRCFRLAFSSKFGKKSFLVPSKRFKCKEMNDKDVLMESLICRLDDNCDKLLICKLDLECKKTLHFDSESSMPRIHGRNRDPISTYRSDFPHEYTYGKSPFPALDGFIESIASFGNVSGKIRSWYWFSQYGLMIYSMLRSRYCEHIGREHKSNHVMFIVDFQRAAYYQKCYDPDCQGYRSPLRPAPLDVMPELSSAVESAQTEYQGEVVEINFDHSSTNGCYPCDGKSVMENCEEDPDWWEAAVKFADSIENIEHASDLCDLEDDDADFWMKAERIMEQIEEQIGSQSNA
ncbi:hypothetical protein BAE44_0019875 [Dichanthelium oligosanthes]|uniref:DNA-directed primase/polymerase protein n=1 Tax=Dichanthelium oligosanthes TaxID=888268 RepID=A0A1E5V207_9POAL|nr:hypothetical protein BAE44_0019875 [Dichanthelium oligosanthes]